MQIPNLPDDRAAAFVQQQSFFREAKATGTAFRELDAQLRLKRAQPPTDGWWGRLEKKSSRRNSTRVNYGSKES
jgi:hypothetical protein